MTAPRLRASTQDGSYPRPQLLRERWADLGGPWDFATDPDDVGQEQGWSGAPGWAPGPAPDARTDGTDGTDAPATSTPSPFTRQIQVPYPPESPASGIGLTDHLPVVWYRRTIASADLDRAGWGVQGDRLLLHLGAVDHRADVWLDGQHLGSHVGGQSPFTFDVTGVVRAAAGRDVVLVVRAEDDPYDAAQPRGKQDWRTEPHSIWYHRTTGIWQPVWLEAVPDTYVEELAWHTDIPDGSVRLVARLNRRPAEPLVLAVRLHHGDDLLAEHQVHLAEQDVRVQVDLPRQANGQQYRELLWSPERPRLIDATVDLLVRGPLLDATGPAQDIGPAIPARPLPLDTVASYLGVRSVGVGGGRFLLNDRPYYLRSVLEQGYWPGTHLAAPSTEALRDEVQLIKDLGFNSARIHQKAEDPRFLFWADRLGLALWAETANAYAFSPRSVEMLTREWAALVRRDVSHPSIVTWVPMNESWGVQHAAHDPAQQHYTLALAQLTRALDPSRPVISNDGWEHTDSDIWSVHDYSERGAEIRARYGSREAVQALLDGFGPEGRRTRLTDVVRSTDRGQPLMLTEFGGVKHPSGRLADWGYYDAADEADFEARITDLLGAIRECPEIAGFCWTQLTDTGQETNGLVHADRTPKLPVELVRRLVVGVPNRRELAWAELTA